MVQSYGFLECRDMCYSIEVVFGGVGGWGGCCGLLGSFGGFVLGFLDVSLSINSSAAVRRPGAGGQQRAGIRAGMGKMLRCPPCLRSSLPGQTPTTGHF